MTSKPKPSENSQNSIVVTFIVVAALSSAAALFYYNHTKTQTKIAHKEQKIAEEKIEKTREEIQALYDAYLNEFTQELRKKAADYKETKRILKEIKNPYNFETPKYAKENYTLFREKIAPSLRQNAASIIATFETYTRKIEADLKGENSELKQDFLQQWKDMTQQQLTDYVTFFTKEDDLILAYDDLITFYYTRSKRYTVDVEKNAFIFKSKQDEKNAARLLSIVEGMQTVPKIKEPPPKK